MRGFHTTLFVLLLMVISTQTLRHVFVKWIEPTASVLDRFPKPVEKDILATKNLEELVVLYEQARARKTGFEEGKSEGEVHLARLNEREPVTDEDEVRAAIERLEEQDRDLFKLRFYWACGLLSVLLGLVAFRRWNGWIGSVAVVTGFVEMAVWTSPLFHTWGPQRTFEHLLTTKLVLSAVSLVLLVGTWLLRERWVRRSAAA